MTIKFGTFMLLAGVAMTAAAQDVQEVSGTIYSTNGIGYAQDSAVGYEIANWYTPAEGEGVSLLPAVLDAINQQNISVIVEGVLAEANGVGVKYLSAEKLLSVVCDEKAQGHTQVLITDFNGVTQGLHHIASANAEISLSDYVPGTYIVAVAVDGNLVKTLKLILK